VQLNLGIRFGGWVGGLLRAFFHHFPVWAAFVEFELPLTWHYSSRAVRDNKNNVLGSWLRSAWGLDPNSVFAFLAFFARRGCPDYDCDLSLIQCSGV
jgi:hypothetical protein